MVRPRWTVPAVGARVISRQHQPATEARHREVRDAAWAAVQSVQYRVTLRWVFYRLLQDGLFASKKDYLELGRVLGMARLQFIEGWAPDTLADDTRDLSLLGEGIRTDEDWLQRATNINIPGQPDYWKYQPNYVIVAFEAGAMQGQFNYYLPPFVSRCAFHGDDSIEHKFKLMEAIDAAACRYDKPVVVIYFGDDDKKGWEIPQVVARDVRAWTDTPFEWVRAGLNEGQGEELGIPENPEKPDTYQWEALNDDLANTLITEAVMEYLDLEGVEVAIEEGRRREAAWERWWEDNRPGVDDLSL